MKKILTPLLIAVFTFFFRVANLLKIPIFTDEAIYIRWAQIGLADPAHRFISLTDGKQPLATWLMYPFLMTFNDPLFAGRFVSVLSGVFAVLGMYFLVRELFGYKTAIIASVLYIFSPFAYVYDRLALMDSLLSGFAVWSLYLQVILVRQIRLDAALLCGITMGLGYLTKSSAQFFLLLMPFSILLQNFSSKRKKLLFLKWIFFMIISLIIANIIYNMLRLSPWFYIINLKNHSFVMTFSEFFKSPFRVFLPNLNGLIPWLVQYLTLPVSLTVIAGLAIGILKKDKSILLLFIWFLAPFSALALFGIVIFPRFMLFMSMPLLAISSYSIWNITKRLNLKGNLFLLPVIFVLFYPLLSTVVLFVKPEAAIIPKSDRNQLFDDWPSGYGVREVVEYIKPIAQKQKVVIGTEGTFGLNPAVYEIYFGNNPDVEIHGFWPVPEVPPILLEASKKYPTFLIFKESQTIPENWPLELISKFRRGRGNTYLLFYRVDPSKIK